MATEIKSNVDIRITIFDNNGKANFLNSNNIIDFHFTENLYSMAIVGKLVFKDMDKIIKGNSNKRNEVIVVNIKQDNLDREWWFKAIDLHARMLSSSETVFQEVTFYITNLEYESMKDLKIASYSSGKLLSDIIKNIVNQSANISNFNGGYDVEASNESYTNFAQFDTSFKLINYLIPRMSGQSGTSGFVFYPCNIPDKDRSFSWFLVTLTSLLKNTNLMKCDSWDDGMYFYSSGDYPTGYPNKMLWYRKTSNYNKLSKNLKAFLTSEFISDGKKPILIVDTLPDMYKKFTGNTSSDSQDYTISKISYHGENDQGMMKNISFDTFVKSLCMVNLHSFEVAGHINRYAGGMINVALPEGTYSEGEEQIGLHLIKSISHIFKGTSTLPYRQILSTIRNTFFDKNIGS